MATDYFPVPGVYIKCFGTSVSRCALEAGSERDLPHFAQHADYRCRRALNTFTTMTRLFRVLGETNRALGDAICCDRRRRAIDTVAQSCISFKSTLIDVLVATAKVSVSARTPLPPYLVASPLALTADVIAWFLLLICCVHSASWRIQFPLVLRCAR